LHLHGAGHLVELRHLLRDLHWLEARLKFTGIHGLVADYDTLPADLELHFIQDALRLASHILIQRPEELCAQLLRRLLIRAKPATATLLKEAQRKKLQPGLRPLTESLAPPGGPLALVFEGHLKPINALAVLPDGRVVSTAYGKTLSVWDLPS